MGTERREQERFSLNLQAKISYRHAADQMPVFDTVAANISSGGAFLTTAHNFPVAAKVAIEFLVTIDDLKKLKFILSVDVLRQVSSGEVWVKTSGIIIRKEQEGVGIIFDTDYQLTPLQSSIA